MGARNILTAAGAVVGGFFGQPQLGMAIGSLIGNLVDPQRLKQPGLKEFPVLGVTEGAYRQVAYGTTVIRDCQLIDWGPLDPVIVEEQQGKGGGPVVESQRLYQTYAVAIGEPIEAVRYIKRDGVMVYDLRPGSTILPESAAFADRLRIYLGDEAQLPDPDLEALALNGVGNAPSYRGTSYFVVVRDDLTDLGGRIPTYEVEVLQATGTVATQVALVTNAKFYSGTPDALTLESSVGWTGSIGPVECSPTGEYAIAAIGLATTGSFFQLRKYDGGTNSWSALSAPSEITRGPLYIRWHPTGEYVAIGAIDNTSSANWRVFWLNGDTLSVRSEADTYMTAGMPCQSAWSDDGALLAVGNASSNPPFGVYDFDAGTGTISGLRQVGNILPGGACDAVAIRPGTNPRYAAVVNSAGYLSVVDFVNVVPDLAASIATPALEKFVAWNAAGTHLFVADETGSFNVKMYAFNDTYGSESLTFVSNATVPLSLAAIDHTQSYDRRYLAFSVGIITDIPPELYSISDDATPVVTKLTSPADVDAVLQGISFAAVATVPQYNDTSVLLSDIVADICDRCGIPAGKIDLAELTDEVKGLTLGGQYDGAGAITTLMPPYFFDLFEADKQIHAPKRGGAVVETITEADFIEDPDENSLRGQDIEYPRKLQLKYLNPGQNYAAPAAVVARTTPDVRVRGEANIDLPICMDETEALRTADRILKTMWEDLNGEVTFSLPAGPFAWLSPTDCLGLSLRGALYRVRVEKVPDVDGVLQVTARRDRQSAYTSTLTAIPLPPPAGPPPSLAGITQFVALNIPGVVDADDQLGIRIGVCGLPGTAWSGAVVRYSIDAGGSWVSLGTFTTPARMGALTTGLPSNLAGYTDATNPLNVTLIDDRQLEAVTQMQLLQEGNGAAIAYADGTAELVQFRDVTDNGARAWTLRTLLRGGLNTEADAHTAGAKFVMLDGTTFVPLPTSLIGQTIRFQFVSSGTSPEASPTFDLVWNPAVSQTELPPASLSLTRGSGLVGASWAPRERFGTDINPVASINSAGLGWRVTLTDGTVTQVHDVLTPSLSTADTAFTGPITASVAQLNRITGAGPATSGVI